MAKAQSTTYRIEHSTVPGCFNIDLRTLDTETASFILSALLARDPCACAISTSTGTPQTEALEEAAHHRALRIVTHEGGMISVATSFTPPFGSVQPAVLHTTITERRHDFPQRQRPGGMTVGDHARGLDPGLQAWAADQIAARTQAVTALHETEASAPHALRDVVRDRLGSGVARALDDTSADLRWFHHAVLEGVDTASHKGLRFELRDATDDCGVRLKCVREHGPEMPLIWINTFDCNTAGECWFENDAAAKRAAMEVVRMRNGQLQSAGQALADIAQQSPHPYHDRKR